MCRSGGQAHQVRVHHDEAEEGGGERDVEDCGRGTKRGRVVIRHTARLRR